MEGQPNLIPASFTTFIPCFYLFFIFSNSFSKTKDNTSKTPKPEGKEILM